MCYPRDVDREQNCLMLCSSLDVVLHPSVSTPPPSSNTSNSRPAGLCYPQVARTPRKTGTNAAGVLAGIKHTDPQVSPLTRPGQIGTTLLVELGDDELLSTRSGPYGALPVEVLGSPRATVFVPAARRS